MGCSSTHWKSDHITAGNNLFDSTRIFYSNNNSNLKIEFIKTESSLFSYIIINSNTPKITTNTYPTNITLHYKDQETTLSGTMMQGNQKLHLDPQATLTFIEILNNNEKVHVSINENEETIDTSSFSKKYNYLLNNNRYIEQFYESFF